MIGRNLVCTSNKITNHKTAYYLLYFRIINTKKIKCTSIWLGLLQYQYISVHLILVICGRQQQLLPRVGAIVRVRTQNTSVRGKLIVYSPNACEHSIESIFEYKFKLFVSSAVFTLHTYIYDCNTYIMKRLKSLIFKRHSYEFAWVLRTSTT